MRRIILGIAAAAALLAASANLRAGLPGISAPTGPAPHARGAWILPNACRISPTGMQITLGNFPLGIAASPDGQYLYITNCGAGLQSVQVVRTKSGAVVQTLPQAILYYGIVASANGRDVWAAGGGAQRVFHFTASAGRLTPAGSLFAPGYPAGLALSPNGRRLYVACNLTHHVLVFDTASHREMARITVGMFPFALALDRTGGRLFVANWGDGTLSGVDTSRNRTLFTVPVGGLPCAVAVASRGDRCYVANANSDTVSEVSAASGRRIRILSMKPYPNAPAGAVPNGLAMSNDGRDLYVSLAGENAVARVDLASGRIAAMAPTAWYPTGICLSAGSRRLAVISSKGFGSGPNAKGGYIGSMIHGTLARIELPFNRSGAATVAVNNGYASRLLHARVKLPVGITHVVLIVRENRTYDQLLGDRPQGNGAPQLAMYGKSVTPALHALADRFAIGDNFYSDGEISAQGHQWTLGANCPDYVEKTWMAYYTARGRFPDSPYSPASYPAAGYGIDNCVAHKVSCRMYGDVVRIGRGGKPLPQLVGKFDPLFRGWDLGYPDTKRAAEWDREFKRGIFPAFEYIWLPNDHTAGTRLGYPSPRAMVADNDAATARIINSLSRSPYWKHTVVFLCEDDSQDGRDHVDAHRNVLLIASPWVKRGAITSRHYSQASVWATMERFLKLPPMSRYDDCADIIDDVWADRPNLSPVSASGTRRYAAERNTRRSPCWRASGRLDLEEADACGHGELERILWRVAHNE